jgi:TP901 family phage tail tape measure protein
VALQVNFATATVDLELNTTRFYRDLTRAHIALTAFQKNWVVTLSMNAAPAQARMNLVLQQLQNLQSQATIRLGATGGGFGRGGGGGPGFLSGVWMGAGLPYAANPMMMAGQMVGAGARASVGQAMSMQARMASLRRVGGFSTEEAGQMEKNMFQVAVGQSGATIEDLLDISESGARAGVRGGPQGMMQFTKDVAMVKNAIGDMPTEELTNRMIQVLNVFNVGTDRVKNFGSALVSMDQASVATARDILDVTTRLSGTASQINLTIPQTVALAATLKNVGLSNEVAGSSLSQIFRKMGSESGKFAAQVGVDADVFQDAYRKDPMDALGLVIQKLKELDDTIAGQEFIDQLGLRGIRVGGALQQLAAKFKDINPLTQQAAKESETLNALLMAQSIKANTAAAALENFTDALKAMGNEMGKHALPVMTDFLQAFTGIIMGEKKEPGGPILPGGGQAQIEPAGFKKAGIGAPEKGVDRNRTFLGLSAEIGWMKMWNRITGTGGKELENLENLMAQKMQRANNAEQVIAAAQPLPKDKFGFPANPAAPPGAPGNQGLADALFRMHTAPIKQRGMIGGAAMGGFGMGIESALMANADLAGRIGEGMKGGLSNIPFMRKPDKDAQPVNNMFANLVERGVQVAQVIGGVKGDVMGAVAGAVGLGVGVVALQAEKEKERRKNVDLSVGISAADIGNKIQEDIFKQFKRDEEDKVADNTKLAVSKLGEIKTALDNGFRNTVAALTE